MSQTKIQRAKKLMDELEKNTTASLMDMEKHLEKILLGPLVKLGFSKESAGDVLDYVIAQGKKQLSQEKQSIVLELLDLGISVENILSEDPE